jgi:hypothetical protein
VFDHVTKGPNGRPSGRNDTKTSIWGSDSGVADFPLKSPSEDIQQSYGAPALPHAKLAPQQAERRSLEWIAHGTDAASLRRTQYRSQHMGENMNMLVGIDVSYFKACVLEMTDLCRSLSLNFPRIKPTSEGCGREIGPLCTERTLSGDQARNLANRK